MADEIIKMYSNKDYLYNICTLEELDVLRITPIEALNILYDLKDKIK